MQEEVPAHSEAENNNAQPNKRVEKCNCPWVSLLVGKVGRLWQAIPHQSEVKGMGIVKAKAGLVDVESYKPVRKRECSSPTKN